MNVELNNGLQPLTKFIVGLLIQPKSLLNEATLPMLGRVILEVKRKETKVGCFFLYFGLFSTFTKNKNGRLLEKENLSLEK